MKNIKLKQLVESIPGIRDEGEGDIKLTKEQKKEILEMVKNFNEYGKDLKSECNFIQTAKKLSDVIKHAEVFAMNETGDWFDKVTVQRNMKELKKLSEDFNKMAKEGQPIIQRMRACFEDAGQILSRYYEISDLPESMSPDSDALLNQSPAVSINQTAPVSNVLEYSDTTSDYISKAQTGIASKLKGGQQLDDKEAALAVSSLDPDDKTKIASDIQRSSTRLDESFLRRAGIKK